MANLGGNPTQGWGEYLHYSFDAGRFAVKNSAIAGRSARSFTREGRFSAVGAAVRPGDWVVVEFGHNDGGSLAHDNGRSDCFGDANQTCETTYKQVPAHLPTCLPACLACLHAPPAKVYNVCKGPGGSTQRKDN